MRQVPSPLGEGGRRPDEGFDFDESKSSPLTLALSPRRGNKQLPLEQVVETGPVDVVASVNSLH